MSTMAVGTKIHNNWVSGPKWDTIAETGLLRHSMAVSIDWGVL